MCGGGEEGYGEGQDRTVSQEVFLAHGEHPSLPRPVLEGEPRAPDSPGPDQRWGGEPSAHWMEAWEALRGPEEDAVREGTLVKAVV